MIKQVLWDWNGTLLNDLQYGIDVRNRSFPAFGLPRINSLEEYYEQFTFPIALYYQRAGVTDEIFDEVAHAWMAEYVRGFSEVKLFEDAVSALRFFREAGIKQVILSATKLDMLKEQVAQFSIEGYFDEFLGLSDIYAKSKEAIGLSYLQSCCIAPQETCMIGDTLHDAEVADKLGTKCLLIPRGHQNRKTLQTSGYPLAECLTDAARQVAKM